MIRPENRPENHPENRLPNRRFEGHDRVHRGKPWPTRLAALRRQPSVTCDPCLRPPSFLG